MHINSNQLRIEPIECQLEAGKLGIPPGLLNANWEIWYCMLLGYNN